MNVKRLYCWPDNKVVCNQPVEFRITWKANKDGMTWSECVCKWHRDPYVNSQQSQGYILTSEIKLNVDESSVDESSEAAAAAETGT